MAAGFDREALRALVRQALRESLPDAAGEAPATDDGLAATIRSALGRGKPAKVSVALHVDGDLDRFARGIVEACVDDEIKAAVLAGDLSFEPRQATPSAPVAKTPTQVQKTGTFEMTSGVLSETRIIEISRTHNRIVVGKDVVLTPLARDKAREIKIELVRQKP